MTCSWPPTACCVAAKKITGGGWNNTLVAQGGGVFRLDEPATLANVQDCGCDGRAGGRKQFIFLRNGLDLTLNLGSAATNPQSAGAVVHGATNNDIINLGSGSNTSMSEAAKPLMAGAARTSST